jgi:rhodanese-related sulfurtransferase
VVREVSPAELVRERAEDPALVLIDVREAWELEIASLAGAIHVPMAEVAARQGEFARDANLVVMCRSGGRSLSIARFLEAQGYQRVANLTGGILAYGRDIDPSLASY